jgi:hypothetical protein
MKKRKNTEIEKRYMGRSGGRNWIRLRREDEKWHWKTKR